MKSDVQAVEVSVDIEASPQTVYDLVSDVTRIGDLSPETVSATWVGGAATAVRGARFRGVNQRGWRRWGTSCTVTVAEPAREFAFSVRSGMLPVADWGYSIAPRGQGCTVTERWVDRRGPLITVLGRLVTGVGDRETHNRNGMRATLDALKVRAEAP